MFNIVEEVNKQESFIKEIYSDLHKNPELGGHEQRTMEVVMKHLKMFNIEAERRDNCGIIAWINKGKKGKKVALRADMDALPLIESPTNLHKARKVISNNKGVMHACGHDGHTAMLVAAAKILASHADDIDGEVVLLFEQGEENGYGANGILKAIEKEEPDAIWGIHLYNELCSGKISVDPGPRMAGNIRLDVDIIGKSGHGSRPDKSINPLDCFVDVYNNLNSMKMTKLNPFSATTFSVCKVSMGTTANVIPEKLNFAGTFRVTDREESKKIISRVKEILDHICALHHCKFNINHGYKPGVNVVMNNPEYVRVAEKAIKKVLGSEYLQSTPPWMASESMSKYLEHTPGVFAFVGIANKEKGTGAPHHNIHFEIDEDVLALGSIATIQFTLDVINSNCIE